MTAEKLMEIGYVAPRILESGEWAALRKMLFTTGLFVGLDDMGWRTRFCYDKPEDASQALLNWSGFGDPPGPWIKEKGKIERSNPFRAQTKPK